MGCVLCSGVDDMLPIFSYIILRSGLPGMVSECAIMDEFIQEGYVSHCVVSTDRSLSLATLWVRKDFV